MIKFKFSAVWIPKIIKLLGFVWEKIISNYLAHLIGQENWLSIMRIPWYLYRLPLVNFFSPTYFSFHYVIDIKILVLRMCSYEILFNRVSVGICDDLLRLWHHFHDLEVGKIKEKMCQWGAIQKHVLTGRKDILIPKLASRW